MGNRFRLLIPTDTASVVMTCQTVCFVVSLNRQLIFSVWLWIADRVSTILGTGTAGCANGGPNTTTLHSPQSVCTDPLKPNNLYIGDYSSIRYSESGITSLIAGSDKAGYLDGSGVKSQFVSVSCLLCHSAGKKLYAADRNNNRIRLINTETDAVTTIAGDGKAENRDGKGTECSIYYPRHMVFDRSPNSKPETVLLITAVDAIRRFDTETGVVTTLKLNTRIKISPWAMDYTPSGHLIVGCTTTHSLYVINPVSGDVDRLAGTGDYGFADGPGLSAKFHSIYAVQIISERQFAIVSDVSNHRLRRVTLPPHLFIAAGKCVHLLCLERADCHLCCCFRRRCSCCIGCQSVGRKDIACRVREATRRIQSFRSQTAGRP